MTSQKTAAKETMIWRKYLKYYSKYGNLPVIFFHFLHQFWKRKKCLEIKIKGVGNLAFIYKGINIVRYYEPKACMAHGIG